MLLIILMFVKWNLKKKLFYISGKDYSKSENLHYEKGIAEV